MTESALTSIAFWQVIGSEEPGHLDRHYDELRYPVAGLDLVALGGVRVDKDHSNFSTETAVDKTRSVETGHAVLDCEPTAGEHESGVPFGDRDRKPSRDERATPTGLKYHVVGRDEVGTCVTRPCVCRRLGAVVEQAKRQIDHGLERIAIYKEADAVPVELPSGGARLDGSRNDWS